MPHFHHFFPKIDSNVHFDSAFSNIGRFNRKMINDVRLFITKNKNIHEFYEYTIKTDFRNMSGSREFRRKNKSKNRLKKPSLPPFSQKTVVYIWKTISSSLLFIVKISVLIHFMYLRLKKPSRNVSIKNLSLHLRIFLTTN